MLHAVTPINMHGLEAAYGSMLSAEHSLDRYQPLNIATTRCNTPVKNLYLSGNTEFQSKFVVHIFTFFIKLTIKISHLTSGQDVFSGGYSGALHGGLLCASTVMDQCLYVDLLLHQKKLKRKVVKKLEWEMRDYICTVDAVLCRTCLLLLRINIWILHRVTGNGIYSGTSVFLLPVLGL